MPGARPEGCFSFIETVIAISVAIGVISTIGVAIKATHDSSQGVQERQQESDIAAEIMTSMFHIPMGMVSDSAAHPAELAELFDGDADIGAISLFSLRRAPGSKGYQIPLKDVAQPGTWEVRVSADLDGDGDTSGPQELFDDLLRIDVLCEGRVILESVRGKAMQ